VARGLLSFSHVLFSTSQRRLAAVLAGLVLASNARATVPNAADESMRQFLAEGDAQHQYRAVRRLEAENRNQKGWLDAVTEYSPPDRFRYQITDEGGSEHIRGKVLKAVLEAERELIAQGDMPRSTLTLANYRFQAKGVDSEGLANVLLSPRRKEHVLVSGTIFLRPSDGALVRLEGRLAKSPSFWVKSVDIVRAYERIDGAVVPVQLETTAQVRFFGKATLRMTYTYSEIDGRPLSSSRVPHS
jgi:hypothetical protein